MKTNYYFELAKKYKEMFGEIPGTIIGISNTFPIYIEMLEYCINQKSTMTNKVINIFFKNAKYDVIYDGEGE